MKSHDLYCFPLLGRAGPLHIAAQIEQSTTSISTPDGPKEGDRQDKIPVFNGREQRKKMLSMYVAGGHWLHFKTECSKMLHEGDSCLKT